MDQFSTFFITVQHTVTCVYDLWKRSASHSSNMSGNTWIAWVPGGIRGRMLLFLGGGAEGRLGASQIEILGCSRAATPLASRCGSAGKKVPRATSVHKERSSYFPWSILYGIYALVVDVSEIEWVGFLIQKRVRIRRVKHFPCGIVLIIYILRRSSFWQPFNFKSFQNAKICLYTQRNDKQKEASAY